MQTENELLPVINETGIETATATLIVDKFTPFLTQVKEWKQKSSELIVTDISQTTEMKMAREARLALKSIRVNADKVRKELKEDSLRYGKAVQSVYNVIESSISPIEDHLEEQEKFKERYEAKQREVLRLEREAISRDYQEYMFANIDLGEITQEDFDKMLNGAKLQKQAADEAAKKAEEERLAIEKIKYLETRRKEDLHRFEVWQFVPAEYKIDSDFPVGKMTEDEYAAVLETAREAKKAHYEEQERIKEEMERLKKEAEEREEQMKLEREKHEQAQQKAKEEADKIKREAEEKAATERKERERLEAELKAKKEKEKQAEADRLAAIEAEAAKGDKEKMNDLIKQLRELPFKFSFKSKKHQAIHKSIIELITKTTDYAKSKL